MSTKPTLSVKIASLFFAATGVILVLGLIKALSEIPFTLDNVSIFLVYIFLSLLCFFVSFGIYKHKRWALYVGFAFGLYLIVNFFINLRNTFPIDLAITGIPIFVIICIVLFILIHKHKHFIH